MSEASALDYVFGYFILNDISDRHAQKEIGNGHWTLGKSWCAPAGAILVTKDHIKEVNNLNLSFIVNKKFYFLCKFYFLMVRFVK